MGHDVRYSRSICQQVLETGESVRLVDVQNFEQWQSQQSILALDLKTLLVVPLCWNDEVTGLLYLDSTSLVQRLEGVLKGANASEGGCKKIPLFEAAGRSCRSKSAVWDFLKASFATMSTLSRHPLEQTS